MEIATFSAIATTTGEVIRMIGALNGMIFDNNNDSVWRRERNDWQKTDDWRTRVRPDEDEARGASRDGDRNNVGDRTNVNETK